MKIPHTFLASIIANSDSEYFEPASIGPQAIVMDVHDGDGHAIDQVTWLCGQKYRWWTRTGSAFFLGEPEIVKSRWCGDALILHETPYDWLLSSCIGICILDWGANLYPHLLGLPELRCTTNALQNCLKDNLARPRLPISVVNHDA